MSIIKKSELDEFVGIDGSIISGDKNTTNDSEIETGPVQKPFNDDSDYEKGMSTTTDRAARYHQNIPWFAVYSYRGASGNGGTRVNEASKRTVLTKNQVEEDLVKKAKNDRDFLDRNFDSKTEKIIDKLDNSELTNDQLEKIKQVILNKLKEKNA